MDAGLKITVVDVDEYYLGVDLAASNGRFAGTIGKIYSGPNELRSLAAGLSGFPSSSRDSRSFELGTPDDSGVTGWVGLGFRAGDGLGHLVLDIRISTAGRTGKIPGTVLETAAFSMATDPASVDRFIQELDDLVVRRSGIACLQASS